MRRTAVLSCLLAVFLFGSGALDLYAQGGLRWVRGGRTIPAGAVVGGQEADGQTLYVCRTVHNGTTLPGKVVEGKCNYNWGTTEYASGNFEILVGTGAYWTRQLNTRTAVMGGASGSTNYYVCRAFASGGTHPGRLQDGKCNYGFGGRGYAATNFEVLNGGGPGVTAVSLLDAAQNGDAQQVRNALRAGQAINQKNFKGQTALMLAASKGSGDVVRILLNEGAAVDARDNDGFTALSYAAFAGDTQSVRLLLRAGANVATRTNAGNTPLYYAAASGNVSTLEAIVSDESFPGLEGGGFPLHGAAAYNRVEMIDHLLNEHEVGIDTVNSNGQTALMVAASSNRPSAIGRLLNAGADVTIRTPNNHDAFTLAAVNDATGAMGALLDSGKFTIRSVPVESGLRIAGRESKLPALKYLIQRGVDVNAVQRNVGTTALMYAAGNGHDDAVKVLLNARADVNIQNAKGETALIMAASAGKKEVVKLLVRAGADASLVDENGKTALQYAIQNKHGDTRKELEKAGRN